MSHASSHTINASTQTAVSMLIWRGNLKNTLINLFKRTKHLTYLNNGNIGLNYSFVKQQWNFGQKNGDGISATLSHCFTHVSSHKEWIRPNQIQSSRVFKRNINQSGCYIYIQQKKICFKFINWNPKTSVHVSKRVWMFNVFLFVGSIKFSGCQPKLSFKLAICNWRLLYNTGTKLESNSAGHWQTCLT